MFIVNGETAVNSELIEVIRLYPGANMFSIYGQGLNSERHLLTNYHARKGENIRDKYKELLNALQSNVRVYNLKE